MKKHRFAIGLSIYAAALLALLIAGLWLFWQYIAAYELSLADGAMDSYTADGLSGDVRREIDLFAANHETPFEDAGRIAAVLHSAVENGELSYRKAPLEYTPEQPVYSILLDKREIGRVYFSASSADTLPFGFPRWLVHHLRLELDGYARDYTVLAPDQAPVTLNGRPITATQCRVSREAPEELLPYSDGLARMPMNALYSFSAYSPIGVGLSSGEDEYAISREGTAITVAPICPDELSDQLYKYAEEFVRAFVAYTSNAAQEAGPEAVAGYLVQGGSLFQRIYAAQEGLSWIQAVTGVITDLTVDSLEYYGSAATLEAHYVITTYGRIVTDNNMKLVLTQTDDGWRVAEIQLFEVQ